jgi:hypothetical protein
VFPPVTASFRREGGLDPKRSNRSEVQITK